MPLVLDASITLAWIYEDETTAAVLRVFDLLKSDSAWVPALWRWEIANVLQTNVRRHHHGEDFRDNALAGLAFFPIRVDAESEFEAWFDSIDLAERHGLTVYDAAYLELAIRRKIPLATLDRELRAAAAKEGLELLGI
jgi:predicted nucleic acid-binding protein